jgi:hypothetical protein
MGADLGERLAHAARAAFGDGAPAVILVGADAPDLGGEHVRTALECIAGSDVVLGPAPDGGYYLVGIAGRAAGRAIPALFGSHVPWGTAEVLSRTLAAAQGADLGVEQLEPLPDIDRPEDLAVWERIIVEDARIREQPRLSVVIPALNEEAEIAGAIQSARDGGAADVIVADGGSTDRTAEVAELAGALVIDSPRGRARQLNAGSAAATGDILLFLHADSRLPSDALDRVREAMSDREAVLGSFGFRAGDPSRATDRLATFVGRLRHRAFRLPYGDQATFVRRRDFVDLGGFPNMPVMEDYEFALRCRRLGGLRRVDADCATSARAWRDHGLLEVALANAAVIVGYRLGVAPERLAGWRERIANRDV